MSNKPEITHELCPECGSAELSEAVKKQEFAYGLGESQRLISALMPVISCAACGYEFTDERAEAARHDAICRHLGVLPPLEIIAIREANSLTRAEFAQVSGVGIASLQRWESGSSIQNLSNDNLIRLLRYESNIQILRNLRVQIASRQTTVEAIRLPSKDSVEDLGNGRRHRSFKRLANLPRLQSVADQWKLRAKG
jgi:putative zinc finger/helix-turn-helix YgiT family protein